MKSVLPKSNLGNLLPYPASLKQKRCKQPKPVTPQVCAWTRASLSTASPQSVEGHLRVLTSSLENTMPDTTATDPNCKFEPGYMLPIIDPMRCEADGSCILACPYDVLGLHTVPRQMRVALPLLGRIKLMVHGGKQAFTVDPDACRGCGLCVQVCPEEAIKLQRRQGEAATSYFVSE